MVAMGFLREFCEKLALRVFRFSLILVSRLFLGATPFERAIGRSRRDAQF